MGSGRRGGPGSVGAGRPGGRVGRPALCVETGGGRGRGEGLGGLLRASRSPRFLLRLHRWLLGGAAWLRRSREGSWPVGRAASDRVRERHGGPGRERLRRGGGGGEGTSRHIRASEQAGGGHIDIDPLPRYEMAHWPAMAATSLRHQERARDWKEEGGCGPAENAANGL